MLDAATPASQDYALYLRKSRGRAGISRQRVITTAHIQRSGGSIRAEFTDTDRTAFQKINEARPDRAGFDALIAFLRAHPGTGVAAWHADRLTRNSRDTDTLMSVCHAGGHLVETPRGGTYDMSTALGRKRLQQDALDASYEVDHMTERITAQKNEAKNLGLWLGGRRPFGFERVPGAGGDEGPTLRIRASEAHLIQTGTQLILAEGVSLASVTRAWNASGLKTSGGNPWTNREVSRVLRRARNAGIAEYGGQEHGPGNWPGIVSEDQWRQCKAILESPGRRTTPGSQPRWLLSGIATCGVCGTPVIVNTVAGKGRPRRPVYRDRPPGGPGHVARDVRMLDWHVSELAIMWLERYGKEAFAENIPDTAALTGERQALRAQLESFTEAFEQGALSGMQLIRASKPVNERIRHIDGRLAEAAALASPMRMFTTDDIRASWESTGLEARRSLIRSLMTITILPSPRGRPAGHRRGEPYFRPETVTIKWKRDTEK